MAKAENLVIKIEIGNDAMRSRGDVETAVRLSLTRHSDYASMHATIQRGDGDAIIDGNGNTVGRWEAT